MKRSFRVFTNYGWSILLLLLLPCQHHFVDGSVATLDWLVHFINTCYAHTSEFCWSWKNTCNTHSLQMKRSFRIYTTYRWSVTPFNSHTTEFYRTWKNACTTNSLKMKRSLSITAEVFTPFIHKQLNSAKHSDCFFISSFFCTVLYNTGNKKKVQTIEWMWL